MQTSFNQIDTEKNTLLNQIKYQDNEITQLKAKLSSLEQTNLNLSSENAKMKNELITHQMDSQSFPKVKKTLEEKEAERSEIRNQPKKADEKADDGSVSRNNKRDKKSKLTLDKMKEREEFLKKFPEFAHDDVMEQGIDGLAQDDVDDRPPALRPGWY